MKTGNKGLKVYNFPEIKTFKYEMYSQPFA